MNTADRFARAGQHAYTGASARRLIAATVGTLATLAVLSRRRRRRSETPGMEPVMLEELSDAERLSRVEASVAALHDRIDQIASALERTNRQRRWRH